MQTETFYARGAFHDGLPVVVTQSNVFGKVLFNFWYYEWVSFDPYVVCLWRIKIVRK
jgi:hypothetical protein